jgi:cytochrome c biogenesis protein CcmG/thiol:disulfide interchange protein DsbE
MHEAPPKNEPLDRPLEQSDDVGCMRPVQHERRSLVRVALQAAALLAVGGLLGLLVYRVIVGSRGSRLVAAIKAHKKPVAPDFHHKVIWPHLETWPESLQRLRASETISPRDLRGHPVVMNFWASWCNPCKREAQRLNASATSHRGQVVFLGVDINDFSTDAVRFLGRHDVNYVSVRARGSGTYEDYGLTGLPETYFLDSRGRIVAHKVGEISSSELEDDIAQTQAGE